MARLNISVPDELCELASKWRGRVNLSEICARALEEELTALDAHRIARVSERPLSAIGRKGRELSERYGLRETVIAGDAEDRDAMSIRDALGAAAAEFLEREIEDDSTIGVAGGRQMWSVVQHLKPRRLRSKLVAIGLRQNDPQLLHVHPNTLVTLLWLSFSPKAEAILIQNENFQAWFSASATETASRRTFIVGSCGRYTPASPLAGLLEPAVRDALERRDALGDFCYAFVDKRGNAIDFRGAGFIPSGQNLFELSRRDNTFVIMVAGGNEKVDMIRYIVKNGWCNILITDDEVASRLLGPPNK